ncbi:TetR/AcrR family transcriptional regulator [Streptomyces aurantiacus]|uniref:TetR/AcrR family transcriptional regulator n=1 Tax=Streptomyces aurantiacus TaxID=47760 RepID=UPI0006E3A909|nr:TetR/AcrR family transcriptional regulator [Streptomyces aurantiacus]
MARWEPDAQARLQQAAMALFTEGGYAEVTIAQIADRAGLTKRTFFNHFTDKREVLFAGAKAFEESVVKHLAEAHDGLDPIDAAVVALTRAGLALAGYGEFARARQELIASSTELQERDLIKMTSLASAMAEALCRIGVPPRTATFTAQAAVTVFTTAYADWITDPGADLDALMQRSLADLRRAVGHPPGHSDRN